MKFLSSKKKKKKNRYRLKVNCIIPCQRCYLCISMAKFDKILYLHGILYISKHCAKPVSSAQLEEVNTLLKWLIDIPQQGSFGVRSKTHLFKSPELCLNHWGTLLYIEAYAGTGQSHPCCIVCWLFFFLTQKISATNPSTIKASNFRTHRKTRFIIHGHLAGADIPWITNICRVWYDYCLTVILLVFKTANIHITPLAGFRFPLKICTAVLLLIQGIYEGKKPQNKAQFHVTALLFLAMSTVHLSLLLNALLLHSPPQGKL